MTTTLLRHDHAITASTGHPGTSTDRRTRRIGRILSTLPILFMLLDGGMKVVKAPPVPEAATQLGLPDSLTVAIGLIALTCTALYAIPRTSVLGAVLLTGYLGGAIAIQARVEAGVYPIVFPLIIAGFVWTGLFLREERLGLLLPLRS